MVARNVIWVFVFSGVCALVACPILEPDAGPLDGGRNDAGAIDAGAIDAGVDVDAGEVDAGVIDVDAGEVDAGVIDAGEVDAGVIDAGVIDAGDVDAGPEAPDGWTCAPHFALDATCDCGCGAIDPACAPQTPATCARTWCGTDGTLGGLVDGSALETCFRPACLPVAGQLPWPDSTAISVVDQAGTPWGENLSGLAFVDASFGAPATLWAVQNAPPTLYRLVWSLPSQAFVDDSIGWPQGATLVYPGGDGAPDAEGVTVGDDAAVYVVSERDGNGPSRLSMLRYATDVFASPLVAEEEWDLTDALAGRGVSVAPNAGFEGVAFISDSLLVAAQWRPNLTSIIYDPSIYGPHGGGVLFAGIEATGEIVAVVLERGGPATLLSLFASGLPAVMALEYDSRAQALWAACDETCGNVVSILAIESDAAENTFGTFAPIATLAPPTGVTTQNLEGLALGAPAYTGLPVFYAHDGGGSPGAVLRAVIPPGGVCAAAN